MRRKPALDEPPAASPRLASPRPVPDPDLRGCGLRQRLAPQRHLDVLGPDLGGVAVSHVLQGDLFLGLGVLTKSSVGVRASSAPGTPSRSGLNRTGAEPRGGWGCCGGSGTRHISVPAGVPGSAGTVHFRDHHSTAEPTRGPLGADRRSPLRSVITVPTRSAPAVRLHVFCYRPGHTASPRVGRNRSES